MYLYFLILIIDFILVYNKPEGFEFENIFSGPFDLNHIAFFLFNGSASLIISFIILLILLPFILCIELKLFSKLNINKKKEEK